MKMKEVPKSLGIVVLIRQDLLWTNTLLLEIVLLLEGKQIVVA